MYRPKRVRWSTTVHAPRTARTIGITHGTPWTETRFVPRFTEEIKTTATPTAATSPMRIDVRLAGGATRPLARRAAERVHSAAPTTATTITRTTQLASGVIRPWTRSYTTVWLRTPALTP